MRPGISGVDIQPFLGRIFTPDHRLRQPMRVRDIVKAETALDAEAVLVRRAVDAVHPGDMLLPLLISADLVADLAADTAIGTDRGDLAVHGSRITPLLLVEDRGFHHGAGRAGLHAFAAADTGAESHRVIKVEDDLRIMAALRHADDVIHLHFAAGAYAEIAMNTGVEVDPHCRMAAIKRRHALGLERREAAVR